MSYGFTARFSRSLLFLLGLSISLVSLFTSAPCRSAYAEELSVLSEYGSAIEEAKAQGKMLLVEFYGKRNVKLEFSLTKVAEDQSIVELLDRYVLARVSNDARIEIDGNEKRILDHVSFQHMHGRDGVAIVDFQSSEKPTFGEVVSVFPFKANRAISNDELRILLQLPEGTLTQRTLVFAVRNHKDRPLSTNGTWHPVLVEATKNHSNYQAQIRVQGHHQWESRFHQINNRLASGMVAQEVCAESWPGEELVEAAEECVRCWRYSSGHWNAVSRDHPVYGYDMKRGNNGIWYATGIFAHHLR